MRPRDPTHAHHNITAVHLLKIRIYHELATVVFEILDVHVVDMSASSENQNDLYFGNLS